jgi:hypothetical protein
LKHHHPKHKKAKAAAMTSFPMAGGLVKMLDHPKPDKTSARRGIVGHAKNFKDGGLSESAFEQKIKETHDKLSSF